MIRTTTLAAAALAAGLAAGPALAQGQSQGNLTATQGGPHGSDPGPIGPQLRAIHDSLLNAERQLAAAERGGQSPNYEQARRALMGGQDTLAELRNARGGRDNHAIGDAEREVTQGLRLLEGPSPQPGQVVTQLRQVANAIYSLASATGGTPAGQPAAGGGTPRQ